MWRKDIDHSVIDGWEHDQEDQLAKDKIRLEEKKFPVHEHQNYSEGRVESKYTEFCNRNRLIDGIWYVTGGKIWI